MSKKNNKVSNSVFDDLEVLRIVDELIGMRAERDEANYRKEKAERELLAIKMSRTWKLGRFILAPYRWVTHK